MGNSSSSGVDGIAGVGGSSGTGGVRAKVREIGDVSGIDADNAQDEAPVPGTIGKGKAGSRDKQGGPGMSGKTRGDNDEGSPSQSGG
ncbi:MAG: hypothetical protein MUD01_12635 [Chloroflexaceae bacterium]|nr:hypothetical protein [Chloroflexaceae bacterium]